MMNPDNKRRLPVGIQSFLRMREDGYLYVDKSDLVWHLANEGPKYCYLSRPRRFGKSVLVDTLRCYFEGRRELFCGLRIMNLEQKWNCYPVVRLDMSCGGASATNIRSYLNRVFGDYEEQYGIHPSPQDSLGDRFDDIITTACHKTGLRVVVLIDEYDAPLLHSWGTPEHEGCAALYREIFAMLKSNDEYEQFVFITGITKFTQLSLFSVLNNLTNISFAPCYAALCGITEEEIDVNFLPELVNMAEANEWTLTDARQRLKNYYDGYHFCAENMVDVYNPFSLVNALYEGVLRNYWASSGATTLLTKFVDDMEIHLHDFDPCSVISDNLESSDVSTGGAEVFLYQSGYLTIKSRDEFGYILGFPNVEVRRALNDIVLPALTLRSCNVVQSIQGRFLRQMGTGQVDGAMRSLQSLIADVPYSNKKMSSMDMEERYRLVISTLLNSLGFDVNVERMLSTGRIDIVACGRTHVYVMELKLQKAGGCSAAVRQIIDRDYLKPFLASHREVIGLGLGLDDNGHGLLDWQVVKPSAQKDDLA